MLSLCIKNILLIEDLEVSFNRGFSIITGESGSGKSIILQSINFVMGAVGGTGLLRIGKDSGFVKLTVGNTDAISELMRKHDIKASENGCLVINRTVLKSGQTKVSINGVTLNIRVLRSISKHLIDICGQNARDNFLNTDSYRATIDNYTGLDLEKLEVAYKKWNESRRKMSDLMEVKRKSEQEAGFLRFAFDELSLLELQKGEEVSLQKDYKYLTSIEKSRNVIAEAASILGEEDDSIMSKLGRVRRILVGLDICEEVNKCLERLSVEVEETISSLSSMSETESENNNMEMIEERLFKIKDMMRKYKKNYSELLEYIVEIEERLQDFESVDDDIMREEVIFQKCREKYLDSAKCVSDVRKGAVDGFVKDILSELDDLGMGNASFVVDINNAPEELWNENGVDIVEFKASMNVGVPPADIAKVASGGEVSRLMLVLKVIMSRINEIDFIFFDEVDVGVSGDILKMIGEKMKVLGDAKVVIAITHNYQVAAMADNHFSVRKSNINNETVSSIERLNKESRIKELAQMMSGKDYSVRAYDTAHDLLTT